MVEIPVIFGCRDNGCRMSSFQSPRIQILNGDYDNFRVLITEVSSSSEESPNNGVTVVHPQMQFSQPGELQFLTKKYEVGKHGQLYFTATFLAKNFRTQDINVRTESGKLTIRAQRFIAKNEGSAYDYVEESIPLDVPLSRNHIRATHASDGKLLVEATVKKTMHKEIPIIIHDKIEAGSDGTDFNATEWVDGITVVKREAGCFLLLRITLESAFELPSSSECSRIGLCCGAGNHLYISGEASWAPSSRGPLEAAFEEYREFRRVFIAPGLIDVNKAKAEVFSGKYLLFEAPLLQ
ncbi:hypothetical protein Aperf_G00000094776 [Anoplocephala perfoliata]